MNNCRGLTLIEVLISSVILFLAVGLVSVTYNQVVLTRLKVSQLYQVSGYLNPIRERIIESLRIEPDLKQGQSRIGIAEYIFFEWEVSDVKTVNSKPDADPQSGTINNGSFDLLLYSISVNISLKDGGEPFRQFEFRHLDWRRRG